MQVSEIKDNQLEAIKPNIYKPRQVSKNENTVENNNNNYSPPSIAWQKDILLEAIDKLEDNVQMDNSHPLGQSINAPIESYQEALIELSFIKSDTFKNEAYNAQANIQPANVISLFVDSF